MASDGLSLIGAQAGYGDAIVLHDTDLSVAPGQIVAVVGANGAGKSTAVRCLMGLIKLRSGRVEIDGNDQTRAPAWSRAAAGIGCVPERRQVFGELSVRENLLVGASSNTKLASGAAFRGRVDEMVDLFPVLGQLMSTPAALLSGGQQQMLAIARALMPRPRFLIMDEPSLGLAPALVADIFRLFRQISAEAGILLLEQNAAAALRIADRGVLFEAGRVVAADTGARMLESPELSRMYLGSSTEVSVARRVGTTERLRAVLDREGR